MATRQASDGRTFAKLIVFNTQADDSPNKYNLQKIYRGLYGWRQTVHTNRGQKIYKYWRPGVLEEIPHMRPTTSTLIVAPVDEEFVTSYLENGGSHWWQKWKGKVNFKIFDVLIDEAEINEAVNNFVSRLLIDNKTLPEYLDMFLGMDLEMGDMSDKIDAIAKYIDQITKHQWIEKSDFAKELDRKIKRVRKRFKS